MASVNNQPNLKPLIDSQSTAQSSELTAVEQAISAGVDTAKTELVAESNSVKAAVNAAKTLITDDAQVKADELASAVLSGKNATEQLFSELALEVEALKTKLNETKAFLDFDVNAVTKISETNLTMKQTDLDGLIYSRSGRGILTRLFGSHRNDLKVYADGKLVIDIEGVTTSDAHLNLMAGGGSEYIKYFETIEVYITATGTSGYDFLITDKAA